TSSLNTLSRYFSGIPQARAASWEVTIGLPSRVARCARARTAYRAAAVVFITFLPVRELARFRPSDGATTHNYPARGSAGRAGTGPRPQDRPTSSPDGGHAASRCYSATRRAPCSCGFAHNRGASSAGMGWAWLTGLGSQGSTLAPPPEAGRPRRPPTPAPRL